MIPISEAIRVKACRLQIPSCVRRTFWKNHILCDTTITRVTLTYALKSVPGMESYLN